MPKLTLEDMRNEGCVCEVIKGRRQGWGLIWNGETGRLNIEGCDYHAKFVSDEIAGTKAEATIRRLIKSHE